jgi:hypothetical protein
LISTFLFATNEKTDRDDDIAGKDNTNGDDHGNNNHDHDHDYDYGSDGDDGDNGGGDNGGGNKTILEIEVRGKRGTGYCKSMPGAVLPFKRLRSRLRPARVYGANAPIEIPETTAEPNGQWRTPEPNDLIFPKWQRELFKTILDEEKLRVDREGQPRTAYSLRHTYICLRLMEGADIYQIAKNCRTSVEMIEKYYASHIKTSLDSVAINVMRPKRKKAKDASFTNVA